MGGRSYEWPRRSGGTSNARKLLPVVRRAIDGGTCPTGGAPERATAALLNLRWALLAARAPSLRAPSAGGHREVMRRPPDFELRQEVCRSLRESEITGPLLDSAEKLTRPRLDPVRQLAFDEALIRWCGLADLYKREVGRKKDKTRQEPDIF